MNKRKRPAHANTTSSIQKSIYPKETTGCSMITNAQEDKKYAYDTTIYNSFRNVFQHFQENNYGSTLRKFTFANIILFMKHPGH
jgi:hypothetical protein